MIISGGLVWFNSFGSLFAKLISVGTMIWVQQYLIKRVDVAEYALLPVIYSFMIFMPIFTETLTGGIRRYVAEAFSEGNQEKITGIVSSIFPALFAASIGLIFAGWLVSLNIEFLINVDPLYSFQAKVIVILLFLGEAIRLLLKPFSNGAFVRQRIAAESMISAGFEIFKSIIIVIVLTSFGAGVVNFVVSGFVVGMLEIVSLLIFSIKLLDSQKFLPSKFDLAILKSMLRFGGWSSIYGFFGMIRKSSDPILLNRFSSPLEVACFNIGALIPNRVEQISNQSFMGALMPQVIGLVVSGQNEKLKILYLTVGRCALWGVLAISFPFIALHSNIVYLYVGPEYKAAGYVLVLLLISFPFTFGNLMVLLLANAKSQMRSLALREGVTTMLNVLLTIYLLAVVNLGAVGSAFATLCCFGFLSFFTHWPFAMSMVEANWRDVIVKVLVPGITPFIASLFLLFFIDRVFQIVGWFQIFLYSAVCGVFYLYLVWKFSLTSDREFVVSKIDAVRKKFMPS